MANPTCRAIINGAIEEARIRGINDAPSPAEAERALRILQNLWNAGVEGGLFGRVEEYVATADYTAEEGQRVFSAGYTITLPTSITDDLTGEVRRPRDFAMVQVVNTATDPQVSLYDAHEAEWKRIDNLTIDGECPFGRRYRHGLEAAIAIALGPRFLKAAADVTAAYAANLRSALGYRMSAPRRNADIEFM